MSGTNGDVSAEGAVQQVLSLREKAKRELERIDKARSALDSEKMKWTCFLHETEGLVEEAKIPLDKPKDSCKLWTEGGTPT